jgi:hypothetical protein
LYLKGGIPLMEEKVNLNEGQEQQTEAKDEDEVDYEIVLIKNQNRIMTLWNEIVQ